MTGANGHLGNNLVRALLERGQRVRAGVHNAGRAGGIKGLDVEIVRADLMDKQSLMDALRGVDTLFQVAAVFRHWARHPERDIIVPSVEGTRNVLEAAAEAGVRRVVYVSSSVTLDGGASGAMDERSWRVDHLGNPYVRAKTESELLAWRVAKELDLNMVSVPPTTIVGPNFDRLTLTVSMALLDRVIRGKLPVSPDMRFTFVDVRDVADGMIAAAHQGGRDERYLLAGDRLTGMVRLAELAREVLPGVLAPMLMPRGVAMTVAALMQGWGRISGREPALLRSQIRLWSAPEVFDAEKARRELGWSPRLSEDAVRDAFGYLKQHMTQ